MPKISQSLIKSLFDYLYGNECGLLFKAKYIDKTYMSEPSDAMQLGIYFEYLCTGMLPKNKVVPVPARTAKGELTAPYKIVEEQAKFFKKIMAHYKIKILSVGLYLETEDCDGLLDILAEWNKEACIIDLKFSGLIDNKWDELGWETKSLPNKDSIMIQGVHYKMLGREALGNDMSFYYFVFNSAKANDMKIIKQVVDESKMAAHKVVISEVKSHLKRLMKDGFKPNASYRRCMNCALFANCEHRAMFPTIEEVQY